MYRKATNRKQADYALVIKTEGNKSLFTSPFNSPKPSGYFM